ncbi:hypothetical protein HaLaN_14444 [Haematococcus lacustris]|uniref:Uncharacterized protein n=1 Tax=Haematococcus lacustris TaxID=44745 RepID=A0A699ZEH0_HAELA|nr:hypothetical protein HaLaN_14444 [Haematococcus lacustris]
MSQRLRACCEGGGNLMAASSLAQCRQVLGSTRAMCLFCPTFLFCPTLVQQLTSPLGLGFGCRCIPPLSCSACSLLWQMAGGSSMGTGPVPILLSTPDSRQHWQLLAGSAAVGLDATIACQSQIKGETCKRFLQSQQPSSSRCKYLEPRIDPGSTLPHSVTGNT